MSSSGGKDDKGFNSKRHGRDAPASSGIDILPNYGSMRVVSVHPV